MLERLAGLTVKELVEELGVDPSVLAGVTTPEMTWSALRAWWERNYGGPLCRRHAHPFAAIC